MESNDCAWTDHDTAICERAEASGMAISLKTNEPLTRAEVERLATEYDKVRDTVTVDEFLKDRVTSRPFDF